MVGDVDYNGIIDSIDASYLMIACRENKIGDDDDFIMPILYAYLKRDYSENEGNDIVNKYGLSFTDGGEVNPIDPRCMNCYDEEYCVVASGTVDTRMINANDSQEILDYTTTVGSGGLYDGMVGTDINDVDALTASSAMMFEVTPKASKTAIYRYNMDVEIFNTMTINGINTFWLPALISKFSYDNKVDLNPEEEFANVCLQHPSYGNNTQPEVWVGSTLAMYGELPFVFDGGMDYVDVYDAINSDTPIYCQFTNGYTSKAVLICGYVLYSDGTAIYRIMNPEYTYIRSTYVSQSEMLNGTTLAYPSDDYTWLRGYVDTF